MGWHEPFFCEFEECGKTADLAIKAHTRSDALLISNMHYLCRRHWYEPVRDVVKYMLNEDEVTGISILLP